MFVEFKKHIYLKAHLKCYFRKVHGPEGIPIYKIHTLYNTIFQLHLKVIFRKLYGPVGGSRVERRPARPEKVLKYHI